MTNSRYLSEFWAYPDRRMEKLLNALPRRQLKSDLQDAMNRFNGGTNGYLNTDEAIDLMAEPASFDELNLLTAVRAKIDMRNARPTRRDAMGIYFLFAFLGFYDEAKARAREEYTRIAARKYPWADRAWITERLLEANTDGSIFDETLQARALYESERLTQIASATMQQGRQPSVHDPVIEQFLQAEQNWLLKASSNGGFHGFLDTTMTNIVGYGAIEDMKRRGIERVQFVAVMDDVTTSACRTLNGKIIPVDKLVLGKNAPPIYPPPHPCRSILIPVSDAGKR